MSWSALSDNFGDEIVGFSVTYNSSTSSHTLQVNQTLSYVFITDNLMAYTNYTITVLALTAKGNVSTEHASTPVNVQTKGLIPSRVLKHFRQTNVTSVSITVEWDKPETDNDNGFLTSYQLFVSSVVKPSTNISVIVPYGHQTDFTFNDLEPYTKYKITAATMNTAGVGPLANLQIRTREAGNITKIGHVYTYSIKI